MEHLGVSDCKGHEVDIAGKSAIVNKKQNTSYMKPPLDKK